MKNVSMILKGTRLAAICLLGMGASAHAQIGQYMINNNTAGDWTNWAYVDFATTTIAGHVDNPTATFGGVSGLKYKLLHLDNGGTINGQQCFEVVTNNPYGMPGVTADTRIWIVSGLGSQTTPLALNDDWNGSLFSAARVWLKGAPSSFVNLEVAAYSPSWNTAQFALLLRQVPANEADCTTNQAEPWIKVINGTMTISANAH
jgi:hypothetical protein